MVNLRAKWIIFSINWLLKILNHFKEIDNSIYNYEIPVEDDYGFKKYSEGLPIDTFSHKNK